MQSAVTDCQKNHPGAIHVPDNPIIAENLLYKKRKSVDENPKNTYTFINCRYPDFLIKYPAVCLFLPMTKELRMNPPSRNQRPDSSRQSSRTSGQKTRPNSGNVKNHPLSAPERLPLTAETEAVHALQPHTNDVSAANPVITDKGRKKSFL